MDNRIPAYFQLDQYHIAPEDVVRGTLHCEPGNIQPRVIVTPIWKVDVFTEVADEITEVVEGSIYQLKYQQQPFTLIRSGIGASQTGDVMLALGCTPCNTAIFIGSVGGLSADMQIGDLIVAEKSLCGDGFSRYLAEKTVPDDGFLQAAEPDLDSTECLKQSASVICRNSAVPLHTGTIFSTDSILAQFFRLGHLADDLHCIGIEMETAAVFKAAQLVGIKASALLQVSDLPLRNKSIYAGRTKQEMKHRKSVRQEVLVRIVLDSLLANP